MPRPRIGSWRNRVDPQPLSRSNPSSPVRIRDFSNSREHLPRLSRKAISMSFASGLNYDEELFPTSKEIKEMAIAGELAKEPRFAKQINSTSPHSNCNGVGDGPPRNTSPPEERLEQSPLKPLTPPTVLAPQALPDATSPSTSQPSLATSPPRITTSHAYSPPRSRASSIVSARRTFYEYWPANKRLSCRYSKVRPLAEERLVWSVLGNLTFVLTSLAIAVPLLVFVILWWPLSLTYKAFKRSCCVGSHHIVMNPADSLIFKNSFGPSPIVQAVLVLEPNRLDGAVDLKKFQNAVMQSVVYKSDSFGDRQYHRFSQRATKRNCGEWSWEQVDQLDIATHFLKIEMVALNNLHSLESYLATLHQQPLSFDKPLWEIRYLPNFSPTGDMLLIFRNHLALADGVSLMQLLDDVFGRQQATQRHQMFAGSTYTFNSLRALLVGPLVFLSLYSSFPQPLNRTGVVQTTREALKAPYQVFISDPLSMDALTKIRQVTHASVTEILLSLIAGAIRSYLQQFGVTNPPDLKCLVAVNLATPHHTLKNKYVNTLFNLPTNTEGVIARLWTVKRRYEMFTNVSDTAVLYHAQSIFSHIMRDSSQLSVWNEFFGNAFCSINNLAGSTHTLNFEGHTCSAMAFWSPPPSNVNLSFSILTYQRELRLGIMARQTVLPHARIFLQEVTTQMQQLYEMIAVRTLNMEFERHMPALEPMDLSMEATEQLQRRLSQIKEKLEVLHNSPPDSRTPEVMEEVTALQCQFYQTLNDLNQEKAATPERNTSTHNSPTHQETMV